MDKENLPSENSKIPKHLIRSENSKIPKHFIRYMEKCQNLKMYKSDCQRKKIYLLA